MTPSGNGSGSSLSTAFHQIVRDIVEILDYTGAMIATYEPDHSLPMRAFYVNPELVSESQIREWETAISNLMQKPVSIIEPDPDFARVNMHDHAHQTNLSVKAARNREPVVADNLYALFGPILPPITESLVNRLIQPIVGLKQIVAVPFFIEMPGKEPEIVGNLFAGKNVPITAQDIRILSAFGRQAAAAIDLERHRQRVLDVARQLTIQMQAHIQHEEEVLRQIVTGIVSGLGYAAAMVSTYETDGSLLLRAVHVSPEVASEEQIRAWEDRVSQLTGRTTSILNPDPSFARVHLHEERFQQNLSVQAVRAGHPVTSDQLFSLFTPVLPMITRPVINHIVQPALGIQQVVAVPFYLEMSSGQWEIIGNLFAATRRTGGFAPEEIELLQAFGRQAAASINNARLYRRAREQQEVAAVFGKMAFSAAAAVHDLRNRIGSARMYLYLMQQFPTLPAAQQEEVLRLNQDLQVQLGDTLHLLDRLHEPWQPVDDTPTQVTICLQEAINKISSQLSTYDVKLQQKLPERLPPLFTVPVMLTEAFKIMLDNSLDAIVESGRSGELQVQAYLDGLYIHVVIQDNGTGIHPHHLPHIFAMKWSTKAKGMGFGLFWAKDYIEGLGGHIEVHSQVGEGAAFHIMLPATGNEPA